MAIRNGYVKPEIKIIKDELQKPISYRDGDIVAGSGRVKHQNNSDYIDASTVDSFTFGEWR